MSLQQYNRRVKGFWSLAMFKWLMVFATVCFHLVQTAQVEAQDTPRFELTPFGGLRTGGEFDDQRTDANAELDSAEISGLAFRIRARPGAHYEILYSRQSTELDSSALFLNQPQFDVRTEYLHGGGSLQFESSPVGQPYFSLTLGATRFSPDPSSLDDEAFLSGSLAAGLRFRPGKRVGASVEARLFGTFLDSDSDVFCQSGSGGSFCAIQVDGSMLWQFEVSAGLNIRF